MDRLERAGWGAAVLLALAPVLLVPSATTNDGPSHLYNAWVAAGIATGDPVLSPVFDVDRG
ncbi:MAG: hypothetical protein GWM90_09345, partial [Gemmatimonadetes bacterium]|nr:hypothetical protein [Gemmatimonadota bacterium]NIQ54108.1 hypothetical protein [Gemmatimonadota bacterium]NIU74306.1 hypothetical protein [Gammaproteobacteria bacterium]NIX44311.1 hypothetical protein [Gemmatimonadota bacterium]NIY08533.1 hypothetical protein [Gemmatimonadota bacterium]